MTVSNNTADIDHNGGGSGGGVDAASVGAGGELTVRDSVISGNVDTGREAPDCVEFGGTIRSLGRTLIGNTTGCEYSPGPGDIVNRRARLSPLAHNGGPTLTHALRKGSPAIDKGRRCPRLDQRGVLRSLGRRCDLGAYERARCEGALVNRVGTAGPDRLEGTGRRDGILAAGGQDLLEGLAGNDGLCGGAGADLLEGGPGRDALDGGPGRDRCLSAAGPRSERRCELPRRR